MLRLDDRAPPCGATPSRADGNCRSLLATVYHSFAPLTSDPQRVQRLAAHSTRKCGPPHERHWPRTARTHGPEPGRRIGPMELIRLITDAGSFVRWDRAVDLDASAGRLSRRAPARRPEIGRRRGDHDRRGILGGRPIALVVSRVAVPRRLHRAVRGSPHRHGYSQGNPTRPSDHRCSSVRGNPGAGGYGRVPHMVDVTKAVMAHRSASLPFLVYLRHPRSPAALWRPGVRSATRPSPSRTRPSASSAPRSTRHSNVALFDRRPDVGTPCAQRDHRRRRGS